MTILGIIPAMGSVCYAVSAWYSAQYYKDLDGVRDRFAVRWLGGGVLLQALALTAQWIQSGYAPFATLDGILLAFSFALALVLFIGHLQARVAFLSLLFVPFIFFLSFLALLFSFATAPSAAAHFMTAALACHIFLTFLGFSSFTMGFGVGMAFWIQEGQLKHHQMGKWSYRLPALEVLERLTVFHIGLGLVFWAGGLALGVVQAYQVWNKIPFLDPKILGSFLVLVIYSILFLLRWCLRIRGKRTMLFVMVGYFLALFTFLGVRVFLNTQHVF
jgi:HemX protein